MTHKYRCLLEADEVHIIDPAGLAPWRSFQEAYDHLLRSCDLAGYTVTLQSLSPVTGDLYAHDHPGCGGKVIVTAPSWTNGIIYASRNSWLHVKGMTLNNTPLYAEWDGMIEFGGPAASDQVTFGAAPGRCHIEAHNQGRVKSTGHYAIRGGATYHIHATGQSLVQITAGGGWVSNWPHFVQAFLGIANANVTWGQDFAYHTIEPGCTPATGKRKYIHKLGLGDPQRQGLPDYETFLPGDSAGETVVGVSFGAYT